MSEKEVARSEPIKAKSSVFKCMVEITKRCEVLLYAKIEIMLSNMQKH